MFHIFVVARVVSQPLTGGIDRDFDSTCSAIYVWVFFFRATTCVFMDLANTSRRVGARNSNRRWRRRLGAPCSCGRRPSWSSLKSGISYMTSTAIYAWNASLRDIGHPRMRQHEIGPALLVGHHILFFLFFLHLLFLFSASVYTFNCSKYIYYKNTLYKTIEKC